MWKLTPIFLILWGVLGGHIGPLTSRIDPLVSTSVGLIRGLRSDDGLYSKFLGIPYALVNEEEPFSPSTPYPEFEEPFDAYDGSVICPQLNRQGEIAGRIQCLHLNIYVPSTAHSENRLPVMVFIHGGAFVGGSGTDPDDMTPNHLIQKDVILVSINYRLGIYGFMCTDSPKAPGNIGLKDQLQALRWVNRHIDSFGGDKNKVTIFGQSAGGMSVHLHLLSPYEKLYERVIIQSGASTSPFSIEDVNNDVPLQVAKTLGFVTEDIDEAIDFISKANVNLAIAAGQIKKGSQYSFEPITKACVEKEFEGIESFVPVNPNAVIPIKAQTVPVMIGYTTQELKGQHEGQSDEFFNNYSFEDLLSFGFNVTDFGEMVEYLRHFYIGDDTPLQGRNEICNMASDFVFNHATKRAVKLLVENDAKAVYQFKFTYVGSLSSYDEASHGDDIRYIFHNGNVTEDDQIVIDRLTTMWTNFAKYGNPTPEITDLLPVKWEPSSKESTSYLNIDKELSLASESFHDRMAFWDLFYQLNEKKTKWYKGE